ncbi:MAG: hypothetical protein KJO98_13405, partial [Rhodothermia bacterium]|nr:hypothetical protein [Rhodothermia bacterium]
NEILARVDALSDEWDLTRIASDVQQIASRQYRAASFVADRFAEAMTERSGTKVWGGRALVTTTPVGLPEKRDLASEALEQLRGRSPSRAWTSVVAAAVDRGVLAARTAIRNSPKGAVDVGSDRRDSVPATAELGTARDLLLLRSDASAEEIANAFVEHVLSRQTPIEPISIVLAEAGVDGKLDLPASAAEFRSGRASNSIHGSDRQTVH